jgi:hypothetical protein
MTIEVVLRAAAAELPGVETAHLDGGTIGFRLGDRLIAAVDADGAAAEFRLDAAVAAAAQRTPDTNASERGPDWVRFAPATLDDHAIDRAVAWLGSAARRAGSD